MDPCTNSNYTSFSVENTDLDLRVDFDKKAILGSVKFRLTPKNNCKSVVLDTSYLDIKNVFIDGKNTPFELQPRSEPFGLPLVIPIDTCSSFLLEVTFSTTDKCTAIQFIDGDTGAYLFSQCQAIHARSLFPCFDTPGFKSKYTMTVNSPAFSLMSGRPVTCSEENTYKFQQPVPIPSYLVAIASGNIVKLPIGRRSDVYCEQPGVKACQWEFERDMETFISIAENLIFNYEWSTFNALVLPMSFPYGGMENPNITFATPTLVSGDRSQVKVMAHELAHSWSGNLVTNCSWEHFWLNEGWTVYIERRLLGAIAEHESRTNGKSEKDAKTYGEQVRHFSAINGWNALVTSVNTIAPEFTSLVWDLDGKDPDDAFSRVPYEKGFNFLFYLETVVGIDNFNRFIKHYFSKYRYLSLSSDEFKSTFTAFFSELDAITQIDWDLWLYGRGMPPVPPKFDDTLAKECISLAEKWAGFEFGGSIDHFNPDQHCLFLDTLHEKLSSANNADKIASALTETYPFYNGSSNSELKSRWNELLITYGNFTSCSELVKDFAAWLGTVGRMKYVRPGYILLQNHISRDFAVETFKLHELKYHPICKTMVKRDLQTS